MTDIERLRAERNFLLDALQRAYEYAQRAEPDVIDTVRATLHDGVYGFQAMKSELHDQQRRVAKNELERVHVEAAGLVDRAQRSGLVLTIEQQACVPLRVGHYRNVIGVRLGHGSYR